jgi:integrase
MPRTKPLFPLWLHPTGQWAKKIAGKYYYFGIAKDAALKKYIELKDDLEAGRRPKGKPRETTVAELVNHFLTTKKGRVDSGELKAKTWADYHAACKAVILAFGRTRLLASLGPDDFAKLRAKLAARLGRVSLADYIVRVRVVFKHAFAYDLIETPIRYGGGFDRPSRKALRTDKAARGQRLIAAGDLRKMIEAADPQVKAMALLGINAALGATDLSLLTRSVLAARPGWLEYPRPKTGIPRTCPLWPETIAALEAVAAIRPGPADPADADRVFLTRCGNPWVRFDGTGGKSSVHDAVGGQFKKLADACGISLVGRFNVLRHTFRTVADETGDRPAIDLVMGHADPSMGAVYRERIADERLRAVVNHVRTWLFRV